MCFGLDVVSSVYTTHLTIHTHLKIPINRKRLLYFVLCMLHNENNVRTMRTEIK